MSVEINLLKTHPTDAEETCYIVQKNSTVLPLATITNVHKEPPIPRQRLIKEAENGSIRNFTDKVEHSFKKCCMCIIGVGWIDKTKSMEREVQRTSYSDGATKPLH